MERQMEKRGTAQSVLDGKPDVKAALAISVRVSAYQNEPCLIFTNINNKAPVLFGIPRNSRYCEAILNQEQRIHDF